MSNIYLTFVSDVTKDYTSNVANSFKVKPNLRLHGEGWKVSIASAMLPKMALFKSLQTANVNLIELYAKTQKVGQTAAWKNGFVKSADLRVWEKTGCCRDGVDFFNSVKHRLEETLHASLDAGYTISADRWLTFQWKKDGVQPELVLHKTTSNANLIYLHKPFVETMQWMSTKNNQAEYMGPNLVHGYASHTKGASSLDNGKPTKILGNWVHLSTLSDWRMINLNQSFEEANNLHSRFLEVTASVTANKVTVTQPLGQVYYAPQGRQRYAFSPVQETFYEVQTPHWDEVEISLKELTGSIVEFQPDSQCIIQLHFTQL